MKIVALLLAALLAGAPATAQVLKAEPLPDDAGVAAPENPGFAGWLAGFRSEALAAGVRPATLDAMLANLRYSPRVVELDRAQPDDSGTVARFDDYVARRVEPVRIGRGRAAKVRHATKLAELEAATGVPAKMVLGIWGMESSYGAVTGTFDVVRSLASLAYDGRRRALFTHELIAALTIVDRGLADPAKLRGSWAGAMGQPQFLPSSFVAYARDGDGDGRADIWDSGDDVAASIANYLATKGWRRGEAWGVAVTLPAGFDRDRVRNLVAPVACARVLAKHSRWIAVADWRALGLTLGEGRAWPDDKALATLVEPDGPGGAAYLTLGNYRVLLDYNCSNFYALSVGLLGDALE